MSSNKVLGRSKLAISELGFGGAPLGNLYQTLSHQEALASVQAALTAGVNYFDTAPMYGHGLSERRIGLALNEHNRNELFISSKVGRLLTPCPKNETVDAGLYQQPPPFNAQYDYSYDGAWRSVEQSLQRLGTNFLDIVFIHDVDTWTHPEEQAQVYRESVDGAARALIEMREQGLIKAFGLGVNEWPVCEQFLADSDPDCFLLAGRYTLLEQEALNSFLPRCQEKDIGLIIGGPYNTGILASGDNEKAYYNYAPAPADIRARVRAMEAVCRTFNVPLAAAALQFPLAHPCVSSVIPGARSPAEVHANAQLIDTPIPTEFWQALKDQQLIHSDAPISKTSHSSTASGLVGGGL